MCVCVCGRERQPSEDYRVNDTVRPPSTAPFSRVRGVCVFNTSAHSNLEAFFSHLKQSELFFFLTVIWKKKACYHCSFPARALQR